MRNLKLAPPEAGAAGWLMSLRVRTQDRIARHALLGSLSTALALVWALALAPPGVAALDPGCDRARPAVAHHAGGVPLSPQPLGAPIPCMAFTGPTTDSAALGVTAAGTIFYGPIEYEEGVLPAPEKIALPTIVVRSRDRGASWERDVPGTAGRPLPIHGGLTDWLSVDPETSRVWYATPTLPCGATVSWSDDEGQRWSHNLNSGCPDQGANALIEGPAPSGGEQPTGYPHVVYYCANAGEVPLGNESFLVCQKSLDGGHTFAYVGSSPDEVPPPEECGTTIRQTRVGAVGRDVNLYFPQNVCGQGVALRLAVSSDEGASWRYEPIMQTRVENLYPPALAVDAKNNLYLAWTGVGALPYLTISRDQGRSWSAPIEIAAPGVTQIRQLAVTARKPRHISLSYLGSTDQGQTFNAYITETSNALAAQPVFWSASVNDPATPVAVAGTSETFGDRIQFLSGMIDSHGTPWAAFHCAFTILCPEARTGIAAHLAKVKLAG